MNNDYKDQEAVFDEIMGKIDQLQKENEVESQSSSCVVDQAVFEEVKNSRKYPDYEQKSPIRRFLDGDEEENEEDEEPPSYPAIYDDPQPDIEDFESVDDRDEIYRDLKNTIGKMAVKGIVTFFLLLASLALFLAEAFPAAVSLNFNSVWFQGLNLALGVLSVVIYFSVFTQGFLKLFRARADTDTLLALFAVSLIAVRIVRMIKPDLIPFSVTLEPILFLGLWFNVHSKKKITSNIKKNFKIIACSGEKYSAAIVPDCEAKNDLILETGTEGDVLFAHKTSFLARFIDHSYNDFNWDAKIQFFLFSTVLLIIVGAVVVWQLIGAGAGILFPAAAFAISVPVFSRYFYAASLFNNCKKIRRAGGVLTSADSAKKLADSDLVVLTEDDLLGEKAVLLQGIKAIGEMQIDDLITNIAALFENTHCPFRSLFGKMIDAATVKLPRVDDIYYHEGLGYSCLIHSKMFLVGNAAMMRHFNIEFPEKLQNLNLGPFRFPVFVAYHKSPVGVFIASYEKNKDTEQAIRIIEDSNINLGIISADFNFNKDFFCRLYEIHAPEHFHFLSNTTGRKCEGFVDHTEKSGDLIASLNGIKGISAALYGVRKLLSSLKVNLLIRIIYTVISLALILFIALAGYSANTAFQILGFQALWFLPVFFICYFNK